MTAKNNVNELTQKYSPRFGQIAVERGYVSAEQAREAIVEQLTDDLAHKPHRHIGRIMLDKGWMTARQIEEVLTEMFRREREK